jgi:outer membrane protein OmpA-like peptidoglycan-associated protein
MAEVVVKRSIVWLASALLIGMAAVARPQDGTVPNCVKDLAGKDPTVDELITALTVPPCKTRGIAPGAVTGAGGAVAPPMVAPPKVSLDQIRFAVNSARISPEARAFLDKLGRAISSDQLSDKAFVIEGHTDITGSLQYNMGLSKRRAESVKVFLIENYKVPANRLRTEGKGPTDLLDEDNPESGINRRVVIMTAKPSE